ncbi:MAG: hypothetical protein JNL90_18630 [Planctomycetes bacterium]|nr:hypothetical protein [Planctomycetota bacterium]
MSAIGQTNALLGNVAKLGFVAVSGVAVWLGWQLHDGDAQRVRELAEKGAEVARLSGAIEQSQRENERLVGEVAAQQEQLAAQQQRLAEQQVEIERLELALKYLKVERRVARLIVLDQSKDANGAVRTKVRFEEVDAQGQPLGTPLEAEVAGEQLYVDALVVKFDDVLVEQGDALRGASLVLFRRLFGERQAPVDGVALDRGGARPAAYGGEGPMAALERTLWGEFWEIADDPQRGRGLGIRSAQGEAPSRRVKKGEVYRLTVRAAGGLEFELDRPGAGGQ